MEEMTVADLKQILDAAVDEHGDEVLQAPVRLAMQPEWPLEYTIGQTRVIGHTGDDSGEGAATLYLGEGTQQRYLPADTCAELGWRR
ncbi:hypothetical protein [Streptomonospora salina]|uniref:Uncharacterized protein n=1 Tax=Streptomonospora salina TaxID=104205 RepID=A0A841EL53_9ACTN|nr:hypothetical protein [Streptomonospora salina]MBB6000121.1 hypothetical protein [Streptomonospora salina]